MKDKIGVAVIGAGRAGMIHAQNFLGRVRGAVLCAVADPDQEARKQAELELGEGIVCGDYGQVLDDDRVHGVVVASPTKYHYKIVIEALEKGKHVLCEKPMALNEMECREMIQAAGKHGKMLQIGFMRRFDSSFRRAKEAIARGEIGEIIQIKSLTRGPSVPKAWMMDVGQSNGPLAEVNSHDIDTLRWFAESEIKEVYAVADNYRFTCQKGKYPDFYDNVLMTVKFQNGIQGLVDGAQGVSYGYDARVEILGTKGIITLGKTKEDPMALCDETGIIKQLHTKSWKTLFREAYFEEDSHFVQCILTGSRPSVTGIDGLMAVKAVGAGNQSIKEGRVVKL